MFWLAHTEAASRTPLTVPVSIRLANNTTMPSSLLVNIGVSYSVGDSRQPRALNATFALPLAMCCRVVAPVKSAAFKLVFDTNREPPALYNTVRRFVCLFACGVTLRDRSALRRCRFGMSMVTRRRYLSVNRVAAIATERYV